MEGFFSRELLDTALEDIYQHPVLSNSQSWAETLTPSQGSQIDLPTLHVDKPANPYDATKYPAGGTVADLYQETDKSVVQIRGYRQTFKDGQPKTERVTGSGFFLTPDGKLATDYHVLQGTSNLMVYTSNGKAYRAHIETVDKSTDLAILQVERENSFELFPVLPLAQSSDTLSPGSPVVALGYPKGWEEMFVSPGSFSNKRFLRDILPEIKGGLIDGENPNRLILENNIHVEGGNSGGPILDANGRVVGIVGLSNNEDTAEATPVEDLLRLLSRTQQSGMGISLASTVRLESQSIPNMPGSYGNLFKLQAEPSLLGTQPNVTSSKDYLATVGVSSPSLEWVNRRKMLDDRTLDSPMPSISHTLFQGLNALDKLQVVRLGIKTSVPGGLLSTALGGYDLIYSDYLSLAQSLKTGSSKDIVYQGLQVTADALLIGGGLASLGSRASLPGACASLAGSAIKIATDGIQYTRSLR